MFNPKRRAGMLPESFKEDCFAAVLEVIRPRTLFVARQLMCKRIFRAFSVRRNDSLPTFWSGINPSSHSGGGLHFLFII